MVGKRDGDEGAAVQPPFIPVEEFQVGGKELYQTSTVACHHQTARRERERKREAGINTVCKEVKSMARVQLSAVSHKPLSSNIHKN